jgi:hypothetical protein
VLAPIFDAWIIEGIMGRFERIPRRYLAAGLVVAAGGIGLATEIVLPGKDNNANQDENTPALAEPRQATVNSIDITHLKKTHIVYHEEDGTRIYHVSTGYELSNGKAEDLCAEGQPMTVMDYNGLDIMVENQDFHEDACADNTLTPEDFQNR